MAKFADDQKWEIPETFRASADLSDEAAHALLLKNDAEQLALSQQVQSPFSHSSPRDTYRRKAKVTIDTLLQFQPLTAEQVEQLAESYAAIGRYDLASITTKLHKKHYKAIWKAVFLDDSKWCQHGEARMGVSEYIWSIKEGKELPLLKCGICGMQNVLDKPEHLVAASKARAAHFGKTQNMTMAQIIQYHKTSVNKSVR